MMTGTSLGDVTTNYSYNSLGELSEYSAQYAGSNIFNTDYQLDDIGWITRLSETVLGKTKVFDYQYDLSGRLWKVERNDTLISEYVYDDNGNRLAYISGGDTIRGVYDDQDRMLAYGNTTFAYTPSGSLKWKAENGAESPPNLLGRDTTFYQYDLMGNLLSVTLPNGDFIEYLIDSQN